MKGFFLLLLAANLLLWSAWNGWLGTDAYQLVNPAHTEPMRLQQQVQPQRVIVGELALRNALPPPGNEKPAIAVCLEIGPFSPADAKTNLQSLAADCAFGFFGVPASASLTRPKRGAGTKSEKPG
jgi:hypothetical protein